MVSYRGRILFSHSPTEVVDIPDGRLVIGDGKIVACGIADDVADPKAREMNLAGRLIIPGLVDCHSHISQLDCRGKHGATLLTWLERYIFPAERAFADLRVVENVATRFFKKLILNGTTTAALYTTVHAEATDRCFALAQTAGIRAIIGKVMMDQHSPEGLLEQTSESLAQSERLCTKWHQASRGRLRYAFTPRFAPTCSEVLWRETGKLVAASGAHLQTHIAETLEENKRVQELFPHHDLFSLYEKTQCCGERTVFAHALHLSDDCYHRMATSKTAIAHCPTSNFFLKSGAFPLSRVEAAGVLYGLGTDVGAGTSMSVMTEMRNSDYTQRDQTIPPHKAFYNATLGGARALALGNEIGNFEIGKVADFAVVDIQAIEPHYRLAELSTDELLSLLMYRGDGGCIESLYVAGEKLDVDVFGVSAV